MKRVKVLLIPIAILIIYLISELIQNLIVINAVTCVSQNGDCPAEIKADLQKLSPNTYKSKKRLVNKYLKDNLYVKDFSIQFKLPDMMKITVSLIDADFAIYDKAGNKYFLVNSDELVIDEQASSTLPYVGVNQPNIKIGDHVSETQIFALKIIQKVNLLYSVKGAQLNMDEEYIKVDLNEKINVLFPITGDIDYLTGSLRIIFSRLNDSEEAIKMDHIRQIDLRFRNPVLR